MRKTIAIGADHRGFELKTYLMASPVADCDIIWLDMGAHSQERSDYPIYALAVVQALLNAQAQYGVLLCGTGVGMTIAANRFAGIYAGLAWDREMARRIKEEDNANILVMPADYISMPLAQDILSTWLFATFKHERYQQRIDLIDDGTI